MCVKWCIHGKGTNHKKGFFMSTFDDALAIIAETNPAKAEELRRLRDAEKAQEAAEELKRLQTDREQAAAAEEQKYEKAVQAYLSGGTAATLGGKKI